MNVTKKRKRTQNFKKQGSRWGKVGVQHISASPRADFFAVGWWTSFWNSKWLQNDGRFLDPVAAFQEHRALRDSHKPPEEGGKSETPSRTLVGTVPVKSTEPSGGRWGQRLAV